MTPPRVPARLLVGPALRAQPDRRLVALAREGHEPALEEVVRRYRPALVRYAATIVPSDRADDVVQEAIARALPKIRDGEAELHLRAWLYTIVRNTALNSIRDAGPAMDHLDENYDGVEQPPQALERREELAAVVAGVRALPDSQREALIKREMEGKSHREIGDSMGVSVAAARQLIHRGRLALREGLGVLLPMPVLRQLLEGLNAPAAAGTGAGGALAAKALVGVLAVGGAVGAGVALDRHSHQPAKGDTIVAEHEAARQGATGGEAADPASGPGGESGSPGSAHNGSGPGPDRGPRGSLESSGKSPGGDGSGGPTAFGPEDSGPGGGGGEHHGGRDHSGESGDGGHHHSGGESGGGDGGSSGSGGGSGDSSEGAEGGSGGSGGSGHSDDPVSNQGPGTASTEGEGSSGPGKYEAEARTDSSGPG